MPRAKYLSKKFNTKGKTLFVVECLWFLCRGCKKVETF